MHHPNCLHVSKCQTLFSEQSCFLAFDNRRGVLDEQRTEPFFDEKGNDLSKWGWNVTGHNDIQKTNQNKAWHDESRSNEIRDHPIDVDVRDIILQVQSQQNRTDRND
jgi:hypothetical protein